MDYEAFLTQWNNDADCVLVHTSGSTGAPKPMMVEKRRMEASARITCAFLGLKPGESALLCMPLDYIAGKMMVVRALTCGLRLVTVAPSSHPLAEVDEPIDFAAMVPMQVANSLKVAAEREKLMAIKHLIIGGGAIDDALEQELRAFPNAVWSTYGMTETLSHIALRRISGCDASLWYTPFESVTVSLDNRGCLVIDAPEVCAQRLVTNDRAEIVDGRFRILGRIDNVVCSGGIKIQIEEVEKSLKPLIQKRFIITKRSDSTLGEALTLLTEESDLEAVRAICQQALPKYHQPRHIFHVEEIPTTETGKPARARAEALANSL
ncbi:MAG: AMP-binding protein [Bacteroidales bacterium]|nr:AMP-binding protein [Bacteroidales bacterium]